jgi:ribosomal protein S18 acetylase RimI-like enzyme
MQKNIHLEKANIDSIDALQEIEQRCFKSFYKAHRFSVDQFRYYLKNPRAITLIAKKDEKVVGYILGLTQRGRLQHIARLYSIAVLPSVRKIGIATQLLKLFVTTVKKYGSERIVLEVAEKNQDAKKLFYKENFRETRYMNNYYGKGINGIQMERDI